MLKKTKALHFLRLLSFSPIAAKILNCMGLYLHHRGARRFLTVLSVAITLIISTGLGAGAAQAPRLSSNAIRQIEALMAEKAARTPTQKKINSHLLYALKMHRGRAIANGVQAMEINVQVDAKNQILVDIKADVTQAVLADIEALGGELISSFPQYGAIRARIPIEKVEVLAGLPGVKFIRPADEAVTNKGAQTDVSISSVTQPPATQPGLRPNFSERANRIRTQLIDAFATPDINTAYTVSEGAIANKVNTSEGDKAHRADLARATYGVDGTGVKIGVLSDGVDTLANRQATGDLPNNVTILPGQAGSGDEGTAMLEIVYDLAPGAELLFATAFNGQASFAANILALRDAGADVIVDDVGYFAEPVFQDGIIAQAVNSVTADGALYFSSAGNSGNLNDGESGVWEGDFVDGGPFSIKPTDLIHDFGGGTLSNEITQTSSPPAPITLHWSDPAGASGNDYDLFSVDANFTTVFSFSTDTQDGNDDPFEIIPPQLVGRHLVIINKNGAAAERFLHLNTNRGRLTLGTDGQTSGHSAAADAYSVAAVDVATATGDGGVFVGGASNPVETFSSDGLRRIFYEADGTPITPGDLSSTGGTVRQKPDIAAADGVMTATPGFNPFYGTSAAAPHAAAIAALLLEASNYAATSAQMRDAITNTALDIEANGVDRDSGYGIVDAFASVDYIIKGAPTITSPVPGSALPDSAITFEWKANGTAATKWWLYAGSSLGARDLYDSGSLGMSLSTDISDLPTDNRQIFVRLWYLLDGVWQYEDFQYIAGTGDPGTPEITSPVPGSEPPDSAVTFKWKANWTAATEWWLYAGNIPGARDLYDSGSLGMDLSTDISNLPLDSEIFVRLWYKDDGKWHFDDFSYPAAGDVIPRTPEITSPVPGSGLSDSAITFEWKANWTAATGWWLYAGNSQGAKDLYDSGPLGMSLSTDISDLPTDGRQIFVRLWYLLNGAWQYEDFQFSALDILPPPTPEITSPVPDSTFPGASVDFQWTDNGAAVTEWWLYVGNSLGARDLYDSGSLGTDLSHTVSGLPVDGRTIYVRLWFRIDGSWQSDDFQYTACINCNPEITSPVPDSTLPGASVTFQWTNNGAAVTEWWLYVGNSLGASDIHDSGSLGTNLSHTVSGLPVDGRKIYVQLWFKIGGSWQSDDFQYTAYKPGGTASARFINNLVCNGNSFNATLTIGGKTLSSNSEIWSSCETFSPGAKSWSLFANTGACGTISGSGSITLDSDVIYDFLLTLDGTNPVLELIERDGDCTTATPFRAGASLEYSTEVFGIESLMEIPNEEGFTTTE